MERILLFDDMDDSNQAERIFFSVDGVDYRLDLARANRERFDAALEPFIRAATPLVKSSGARKPQRGAHRATGPQSATAIRAWASAQGMPVAPKGKIAQSVIDAYSQAAS